MPLLRGSSIIKSVVGNLAAQGRNLVSRQVNKTIAGIGAGIGIASVGNSLVNKFTGALTSKLQGVVTGKINDFAKKLISRSPLEIKDDDSAGVTTVNPFNFGMLYYPEEVAQLGTEHYMIFDIIENQKSKTTFPKNAGSTGITLKEALSAQKRDLFSEEAKKRVKENSVLGGINSGNNNPTHTRISDSIILYTPANLKTTFLTEYEAATTGLAGAGAIKATDGIEKAFEVLRTLGREVGSAGLSVIPGVGDFGAVRAKVTGETINPNIETVFRSVPMREFNFVYDFAPKNKKELDMVYKILRLLRFHMLPDVTDGRLMLVSPSEFNITYMYLNQQNNYIPRISRCVLKSMEMDQTPENVLSTLVPDNLGAAPTVTKVSLTFMETEIMTKAKVAKEGF